MNINTSNRKIIYLIFLFCLSFLLLREYTYVHPFNTGYFILGPKWTYSSTKTLTWWFILIGSVLLILPILRKQKIGYLGFVLFIITMIRPLVQNKFPEETASEFYNERKSDLFSIIRKHKEQNDIDNHNVKRLGFEKLVIYNETYYFLVCDEEWPFGICYNENKKLPKKIFDSNLKYNKIDNYWYEFDY